MERTQRMQVELLNQQVLALRQQLAQLATALDASEAKAKEQGVQIADLGKRLNVALANKVAELAGYRSEFFGKLKQVLGERPDIQIVGDRFVFQSEVLFDVGSADIADAGKQQLAQFAQDAAGDRGQDPQGHRLDPARRRPHRQASDQHLPVPLELGAVLRARHRRGQLPGQPGRALQPAGRGRLRRDSARSMPPTTRSPIAATGGSS